MLAYTKTRFHDIRVRLEGHVPQGKLDGFLWEFFLFGFKQGWACLFGALMLGLLIATKFLWPPHAPFHRYDFLFLSAIVIQAALLFLRMETVKEVKVIIIFHIIGTMMELFKTSVGSWSYPEASVFHIGHVPLFSGFMYGAVGSYLARISRIIDMRYTFYPSRNFTIVVGCLIYANFFTDYLHLDARVFIFGIVTAAFGPTMVYYKPYRVYRRMPLMLGFALVALFIWFGENIGTLTSVWLYPNQVHGWAHVNYAKFGSWFLLMIVSFILVSFVRPPRHPDEVSED